MSLNRWWEEGRQTLGCSPVFLNSWCRYHWIHQQFLLPPYQPWAKRQQKSQTSWRPKFLDQLVCSCLFLPSSLIHFDDFWWFLIPWIWIASFWSMPRRGVHGSWPSMFPPRGRGHLTPRWLEGVTRGGDLGDACAGYDIAQQDKGKLHKANKGKSEWKRLSSVAYSVCNYHINRRLFSSTTWVILERAMAQSMAAMISRGYWGIRFGFGVACILLTYMVTSLRRGCEESYSSCALMSINYTHIFDK